MKRSGPTLRACPLVQATSAPDPDTGKEEQANPRPPEDAVVGGQVRFDDEKLIGMAFVMMGFQDSTFSVIAFATTARDEAA